MAAPTVRQQRLAAELRRLRMQARYTGDEAAREMGWSPAKFSRVETAKFRDTARRRAHSSSTSTRSTATGTWRS